MRRTKIVCTIGPASDNPAVIRELLSAGMDVARLNFSHGTREEHGQRLRMLRRLAGEEGKNLAVLLDTKGPEIRLGYLEKEPVVLEQGKYTVLTTEPVKGNADLLPVSYPGLPADVHPGDTILLADGLIGLKVVSTDGRKEIRCLVENGGELTSQKGVNLPGVATSLPAVTHQDVEDIMFGISAGVDFIAASFIRRAQDVLEIRRIIEENNGKQHIIAKIENAQGVTNLADIVSVSDGVMVARGDLGVEIAVEEVPLVQKDIIRRCNLAGKPVVTATQMLESMIHNPRPTRAEASDVANAILDGTDAIMLSGETAAGKYPVQAVRTMDRIARRTEAALPFEEMMDRQRRNLSGTVTGAISHATVTSADDLGAAAIITITQSGCTAQMVSRYRPRAPIIAITPIPEVRRRLALVWGVESLAARPMEGTDQLIAEAFDVALDAGLIKPGDLVVVSAGVPAGVPGSTNMVRVHTVGDILARGVGIGTGSVTGTVRVARSAQEAESRVQTGDVLVVSSTDREFVPGMAKLGALVTEAAGLTSHGAIVALEYGKPAVVGVENATSQLPDGVTVTVDARRGLIYRGPARVL
ncbi:MAG TPA: pyruvate kinase [Spirochaetia bacterium]|nr:pyruvate kinase [Spirochaetia bacterium]